MTAHELGKFLLTLPDLPVMMNGWGSDEGIDVEVTGGHIVKVERQNIIKEEIHLEHEEVKW